MKALDQIVDFHIKLACFLVQILDIDFITFDFIAYNLKSMLLLFQLGFKMFKMTSVLRLVETHFFRQTSDVLFNLVETLVDLIETTFHLFEALVDLIETTFHLVQNACPFAP